MPRGKAIPENETSHANTACSEMKPDSKTGYPDRASAKKGAYSDRLAAFCVTMWLPLEGGEKKRMMALADIATGSDDRLKGP